MKITNANQLTIYAIKVLTAAGFKCWRQNNGGVYNERLGRFMKNPNTLKGVSDIMGFCRTSGRVLACEIKVGKDKLSPEQTKFLAAVDKAGGFTFVVRHADDLAFLLHD